LDVLLDESSCEVALAHAQQFGRNCVRFSVEDFGRVLGALLLERDVADVQQSSNKLDDGAEFSVFNAHHAHAVGCVREGIGVGDVSRGVTAAHDENTGQSNARLFVCCGGSRIGSVSGLCWGMRTR